MDLNTTIRRPNLASYCSKISYYSFPNGEQQRIYEGTNSYDDVTDDIQSINLKNPCLKVHIFLKPQPRTRINLNNTIRRPKLTSYGSKFSYYSFPNGEWYTNKDSAKKKIHGMIVRLGLHSIIP